MIKIQRTKKREGGAGVKTRTDGRRMDLKKYTNQKENKSMKQYQEFASDIIKNVGGKGNIQSVRHCYTRLRFRLEDEERPMKRP